MHSLYRFTLATLGAMLHLGAPAPDTNAENAAQASSSAAQRRAKRQPSQGAAPAIVTGNWGTDGTGPAYRRSIRRYIQDDLLSQS